MIFAGANLVKMVESRIAFWNKTLLWCDILKTVVAAICGGVKKINSENTSAGLVKTEVQIDRYWLQ
jgi:hypothetical protein